MSDIPQEEPALNREESAGTAGTEGTALSGLSLGHSISSSAVNSFRRGVDEIRIQASRQGGIPQVVAAGVGAVGAVLQGATRAGLVGSAARQLQEIREEEGKAQEDEDDDEVLYDTRSQFFLDYVGESHDTHKFNAEEKLPKDEKKMKESLRLKQMGLEKSEAKLKREVTQKTVLLHSLDLLRRNIKSLRAEKSEAAAEVQETKEAMKRLKEMQQISVDALAGNIRPDWRDKTSECVQEHAGVDTSEKWEQLGNTGLERLARTLDHMRWRDSTHCKVKTWRQSRLHSNDFSESTEAFMKHLQFSVNFDPAAEAAHEAAAAQVAFEAEVGAHVQAQAEIQAHLLAMRALVNKDPTVAEDPTFKRHLEQMLDGTKGEERASKKQKISD